MEIKAKQEELITKFKQFNDWEEKYAEIIKMGKTLPEFPEERRIEKNKIEGCQSQVWMHAEYKDGKIYFYADSDAMIVKGLIALLLKVYSGHTPEEILNSPPDFLKKIGIDTHLSPTRKNGLYSMLKQIQLYAVAFKSLRNK